MCGDVYRRGGRSRFNSHRRHGTTVCVVRVELTHCNIACSGGIVVYTASVCFINMYSVALYPSILMNEKRWRPTDDDSCRIHRQCRKV